MKNHTSSRNGGRGKKKKSPVWDWHFGVVWIRQLDLQMTPSHLCLSRNPTPVPQKRGSQCFNDGHGVSTHTICTFLHEQSVHKCNITVRRLHHIFPANYIMTQTALWKTIPGANVWLFYTKLKQCGDNSGFWLVLRCAKKWIMWKMPNPVCQWLSQNTWQQMSRKQRNRPIGTISSTCMLGGQR